MPPVVPRDLALSFTFRFGTVCDDMIPEEREAFTIVVTEVHEDFKPDSPSVEHYGTSISRSVLINDDDQNFGPPEDLDVQPATATSLNLSWSAPGGTGNAAPEQYLVQYHPTTGSVGDWINAGVTNDTSFTISGLTEGTPYVVRVCSQRADGTPDPPPGDGPGDFCALGNGSPGLDNSPPEVAEQLPDIEVGVEQTATVLLDGAFADADPDDVGKLTYQVSTSDPSIATVTRSGSGSGASAAVRGVAAGTATITVVATDTKRNTARQSFMVTVRPNPVNQPPVPGPVELPAVEIGIGQSRTVTLLGAFEDPEGQILTYGASTSDSSIVSVTGPATGESSFSIRGEKAGTATITVTATDGERGPGRPSVRTFEVTVTPAPVDLPPVPDQDLPDVTVGVGQTHSVTLSGAFIDPEGDPISYTPVPSITRPDLATLSALQSGSFTITGVQAGTARVTVSATDGRSGPGRPAVQFFQVTVTPEPVNQPPGPGDADLPDRDVALGEDVVIDLAGVFVDPEADTLYYLETASNPAVVLCCSRATASAPTFELRGVGVGESLVSVTADDRQDGPGRPARRDFTVTVALAVPPVVGGLSVEIDARSIVTATWDSLPSFWDSTYDVEARPGAGLEGQEPRLVSGALEPPVLFTDLVPGTWSVRIRAVNRVGEGPWSEPEEVVVAEPPPAVFRFGRADLPVPKPSFCPRPDTLYIEEGFMEVHLDRAVDFEVDVMVEIDAGPPGHIVLEQPGPTVANEGVATFAPGLTTVRFVARVECRVNLGDVYTFVLRYPRAPFGGGTAVVDPDHGRLELTVGTPVPALPAGGAVLLAALLAAARLRGRWHGDVRS